MSDHSSVCGICRETFCNIETRCGHHFHTKCLETWLKSEAACPYCRGFVTSSASTENFLRSFKGTAEEVNGLREKDLIDVICALPHDKKIPFEEVIARLEEESYESDTPVGETVPKILRIALVKDHIELARRLLRSKGISLKEKRATSKNSLLHLACLKGHADIVEDLIKMKYNVNAKGDQGATPIHLACGMGNVGCVKLLLENGADPNVFDKAQLSPIIFAINKSNAVEIFELMIDHGADINSLNNSDGQKLTALAEACKQGRVDLIEYLISKGADIQATNSLGHSLLLFPILGKNMAVVKYLVENGIVSVKESDHSILLSAIKNGSIEMVKYLVENGINLDYSNKSEIQLPVLCACRENKFDIARYLMEQGASIDRSDESAIKIVDHLIGASSSDPEALGLLEDVLDKLFAMGHTAKTLELLQFAVLHNNQEMFDKFLTMGFDVNAPDIYGKTPIFYSSTKYMLEQLILRNADLNILSKTGSTPFLEICKNGSKDSFDVLLKCNVNIYAVDFKGRNALHYAALGVEAEITRRLISMGFDVNGPDYNGQTPIHCAGEFLKSIRYPQRSVLYPENFVFTILGVKEIEALYQNGCFIRQKDKNGIRFIDLIENPITLEILKNHFGKWFVEYFSKDNNLSLDFSQEFILLHPEPAPVIPQPTQPSNSNCCTIQ